MKIVLDTNVLVAGLLNPEGNPGRVVDLVLAGEATLLADDRVLRKYRSVLHRPKFGFDLADIAELLDYLRGESERVSAPPVEVEIAVPGDLPFLEVAVAGRADALVTGNVRDFRQPQQSLGVRVVTPSEFIRSWRLKTP